MTSFSYPAHIRSEGPDDWVVTFRDVPEAITGGASFAEAYGLAADALAVAAEIYLDAGNPVPEPSSPHAGEVLIGLAPHLAARQILIRVMAEADVSRRGLAERMGKDEKHVRRILSGSASFDQSMAALAVLGIRPTLEVLSAPAVIQAT